MIVAHPDDQTGQHVPSTQVWIGNQYAAENQAWLQETGIGAIVSAIGEPREGKIQDVEYLILDLDDSDSQDMVDVIREVHAWIVNRTTYFPEAGILVHCAAGVSRSSTLVIGHLLLSRPHWKVQEAIDWVKRVRPVIQPNDKFLRELDELVRLRDEASLHGEPTNSIDL
jgi:predicted protein tyrosine phosphatase